MKTRRKPLEFRLETTHFIKIIPRVSSMVCKTKIIFKILTPVTFVFRGIKRMICSGIERSLKKPLSLKQILATDEQILAKEQILATGEQILATDFGVHRERHSNDILPDAEHERYFNEKQLIVSLQNNLETKPIFGACEERHLSYYRNNDIFPNRENEKSLKNIIQVGEVFSWTNSNLKNKNCISCQKDCPAYNTCRLCIKLYLSLPPPSCAKCQREKPLFNLCLKYHQKSPTIYVSKTLKSDVMYQRFVHELRSMSRRNATEECSGKTHTVNVCPVCLYIWPMIGECRCQYCEKTQPVVKILYSQRQKTIVDACPCTLCSDMQPKVKICDICKETTVKQKLPLYIYMS